MRKIRTSLFAVVFSAFISRAAVAEVVIHVSKSEQSMRVYVDRRLEYVWDVSTARRGYNTPDGVYRPTTLDRFHRSSIYGNAPMPYSIFFRGGYAIHGSSSVNDLGAPASHGCIRLHPDDARDLFRLVEDYGVSGTRIVISR